MAANGVVNDAIDGNLQRVNDCHNGEEGRRGYPAALDLAKRFRGNPCFRGNVDDAAIATCLTQHRSQALTAFSL